MTIALTVIMCKSMVESKRSKASNAKAEQEKQIETRRDYVQMHGRA